MTNNYHSTGQGPEHGICNKKRLRPAPSLAETLRKAGYLFLGPFLPSALEVSGQEEKERRKGKGENEKKERERKKGKERRGRRERNQAIANVRRKEGYR